MAHSKRSNVVLKRIVPILDCHNTFYSSTCVHVILSLQYTKYTHIRMYQLENGFEIGTCNLFYTHTLYTLPSTNCEIIRKPSIWSDKAPFVVITFKSIAERHHSYSNWYHLLIFASKRQHRCNILFCISLKEQIKHH